MNIKDIVNLDFREQDNKNIIQEWLNKIPYIQKNNTDLDTLINFTHKICRKYKIWLKIKNDPFVHKDYDVWSSTLIDDLTLETINKIYGMCIYELFAKQLLYLYAYTRKKR